MPRANLTLPNGTKISIEGTEDEVRRLLSSLGGENAPKPASRSSKAARKASKKAPASKATTTKDYIRELISEGHFQQPQGLSSVAAALATNGHILPLTSLSGPMLGLVKSRELRRLKDGKIWKYVQR